MRMSSATPHHQEITAVVLAGGMGLRLREVVSHRPKVLVEVCGRPFLGFLFDQLCAAGIRHVVLCTGYMADSVRDTYGVSYGSLELEYSQESQPLGTGGALRLALPQVRSNPVLVMNGDSFVDAGLEDFLSRHSERGCDVSILMTYVPDTARYGSMKVQEDGLVLAFEEKGEGHGPGWINAGVYLVKTSVIEALPPGEKVSLEWQAFPPLVGKGLYGCPCNGRFIDIGTPESYHRAEEFFSRPHQETVCRQDDL